MKTPSDRFVMAHTLKAMGREWRLRRLTRQANRWRGKLAENPDASGAGFSRWLLRSPDHVRLWLELTAFDEELSRSLGYPALAAVAAVVPDGARSVIARQAPLPRRAGRRWALAASLAMAALLTVLLLTSRFVHGVRTYTTAVGEQNRLRLEDGSMITLNTDSTLVAQMSERERRVTLVRGEALFDPSPDAARPFRVIVGHALIEDVGTRFTVRQLPGDEFTLVVSEGRVRVSRKDSDASSAQRVASVELSAGEAAGFRSRTARLSRPVTRLDESDLASRLLWTQGRVLFTGQPLREALAEMNRYSPRLLVVEDPAILEVPIGGAFRTGDPMGFAEALARLGFCDVDPAAKDSGSRTIGLLRHGTRSSSAPAPSP